MKILSISIENFRKLKKIQFDCNNAINTIVGPNGVGKSTILEALRLVKGTLLQSFENESMTTLQNMGLLTPQLQNYLLDNLLGDKSKPLNVHIKIKIEKEELDYVKNQLENFAVLRLQNALTQNNRLALINYLSNPHGQNEINRLKQEAQRLIAEFEKESIADVSLIVDTNSSMRGENGFHQELISFILRRSNYTETMFSIFPADRSFPMGDINIQLGQQDINLQTQSYSMQPNIKFQRLKASIIAYLLINNNDLTKIQEDFKLIFEHLIPGKELEGIRLEKITGRLSVLIKESASNSVYDIDFLSSGEKGLLLTLFLLLRTIAKGGIVLLDEPELHLNPAVLRNIIPFLKDYICKKKDVQIILTTHSAEILASTKEDESLSLLHLIDEKTISPIYKKDNSEAQDALRCLGIEASDILFNKGVIYLEGNTDTEYINELFKGITTGYKIQSLGGRGILETEIQILQKSDKNKQLEGFHVFLLDLDNKPTKLTSSESVIVIQWDRYSFENYLLNNDDLYDVIKDLNPQGFPANRAEFNRNLKELAFSQIEKTVLLESYGSFIPQSITLQKKEVEENSLDQIVTLIVSKLESIKSFISNFDEQKFKESFRAGVTNKIKEAEEDWEVNWKRKCKGKELLVNVYEKYKLTNYKQFIKSLIRSIKQNEREEWQIIKSKIEPVLKRK